MIRYFQNILSLYINKYQEQRDLLLHCTIDIHDRFNRENISTS